MRTLVEALVIFIRGCADSARCHAPYFANQEAVYEEFTSKYAAKVAALKIGNGAAPGVEIGPLINQVPRYCSKLRLR